MIPDSRLYDKLPPEVQAVMERPKTRKKRNNEESRIQKSFVLWWRNNCRHFNVPEILLFKITNEGGRGPIVGSILKAEGLRTGCPDMMLAVSRSGRELMVGGESWAVSNFYGLFLELKRPAGIVSPEQEVFHQRLREQGYAVHVVRSLQECINVTTTYLTK